MKNLEDNYWKQVEDLNWGKEHSVLRIEKELKKNHTLSECIQLDDFVQNKVRQLKRKFHTDWLNNPGIDVSDDGWDDLTNEVVGRGKEFYENITVEKLQEMANNSDYCENFSYCFQWTWDKKLI
jgi:hypothetical protein